MTSSSSSENKFATPFDVPANYSGPTNFSPKVASDFVGLVIAAPEQVNVGQVSPGELVCPVSLTFEFNYAFLSTIRGPETDHMVVVAIDAKTGKSYSNTLQRDDSVPSDADDRPKLSAQEMQNIRSKGYFTFDLASVLQLPKKAATYRVHVTLEKYQSNVVTIMVRSGSK
ncbi:MAG: hypothetical protein HY273_11490 [Gammaproteobacteria bacterium]|nr:hypothetical protein [Gammaproteobacteria bacterium]